jgi:ferredoxin-NADP reductase
LVWCTQVGVQVGGTFTLAQSSEHRPALFVAGGIGITCLSSMLGHLVDMEGRQQPLLLMYSAASPEEYALLPRLLAWQQRGKLRMQLHTTQAHGLGQHLQRQAGLTTQEGRIDAAALAAALQDLHTKPQDVDAYVCGPPQMTDSVVEWLAQLGVPPDSVHTEKWW